MADFISIPLLNTLTFVDITDQTDEQSFHNRLDWQESYRNHVITPLYQKIHITDPILIQITTNYTTKNVYLVNVITGAETDITGAVVNYSTAWSTITSWPTVNYDTLTAFDKTVYTGQLEGWYNVRIEFNGGVTYESQIFQVGDFSDYPVLSWSHSIVGLRKGIYWSGVEEFQTRIDTKLIEFQPGIELVTNKSFNEVIEDLDANAVFYAILDLGAFPRYLLEKLNIVLQVNTKKINDIEYKVESGIEQEFVRGINTTNIYTGTLKLRLKDYEIYEDFESLAPVEVPYILINEADGDYLTINADGDYLIYQAE